MRFRKCTLFAVAVSRTSSSSFPLHSCCCLFLTYQLFVAAQTHVVAVSLYLLFPSSTTYNSIQATFMPTDPPKSDTTIKKETTTPQVAPVEKEEPREKPNEEVPRPVKPGRAAFVEEVKSTIAIGLLSTTSFHKRIHEALSSWWNLEEFEDLVTIFSDSVDGVVNAEGKKLVGSVKTYCDTTYHTGLWCKNQYMFEYWLNDTRFDKVQWFVRVMDDSYVHMENLLDLVSKYDPKEKIVLADKFCTHYSIPYPVGGAGIVFSRAVLEDFNVTHWHAPYKLAQKERREIWDDVAWGDYLHLRKIPTINHFGIHQASNRPDSPHWNYWMNFEKGNGRKWNLPYRPVLLHQHGAPMPMKFVHEKLHNLSYTPLAEQVMQIPDCKCPIGKHQKCVWDQQLTDSGLCKWGFERLQCIGPGPWALP